MAEGLSTTGTAAGTAADGTGPADPAGPAGMPGDQGLDKSGRVIQAMFGKVARHYDLLNHLLSAGLDLVWRRQAAAVVAAGFPRQGFAATASDPAPHGSVAADPGVPGGSSTAADAGFPRRGFAASPRVLDLCAGTGDQAVALRRRGARVAAADFCLPMLALSRRKFARLAAPRPRPLAADALALPFRDRWFAAATVSFGLRNVADLDAALGQLASVLAPGGRLVVLEFAVPTLPPLRALYLFYFRRLLPLIGRLLSDSTSAYDYLPSSVLGFPQRHAFLDRMAAAGFAELAWRDLSGGIVCLYSGTAAPAASPPALSSPTRRSDA